MIPSNCNHCAKCCYLRVKLSLFEYLKLRLKGHKNFTEKNAQGKRCIIQMENDRCYFLSGNKCKIYSIRPKMCREYPGVDVCPDGKNHEGL
ncbi:MAG: YkgJ family cysteine cluster protein [Candidatus Woesearchaeota archaeon]